MRLLALLCLVPLLALAGPKTSKKKKAAPPPPPAAEAEMKKALDATQAKVGGCVVAGVEPGVKTWTQVVKLKVVVNGVGQLMSLDTALVPENASAAKTKSCIEDALKAATFPTTHAPMVTLEREWTFAMQ